MFAVVLVGGFGTRLRPLTNEIPKPMLPVAHRPMIVPLVERLAAGGVTDVVLALGFRPEPFYSAFPDRCHGETRLHYAIEPEPLDTAGAIGFAARDVGIDDTFVVANGDVICDVDIGGLVDRHRSDGAVATLHLTEVADPSAFGVVETDEHRIVQRFVEKPAPGVTPSRQINAGTYVMEPEVLDLIPPLQRCSVEREIFPTLVDGGRLLGIATDDYWLDTGRPDQYLQANLDAVDGTRQHRDPAVHTEARIDATASVDQSVVGAMAAVDGEAVVHESLLLPGAVVQRGARLERSIVAGVVGPGAVVVDSVIGAGYHVPAGSDVLAERLPAP